MRVFVAGATGATGRVFVSTADATPAAGAELVLHVRPRTAARSPLGQDPRARVFELDDAASLATALAGCDAIVSFVGTMRGRFATGDTYEASDVGTTRALAQGGAAAGVKRMLLLSSLGAGGVGAYLEAKGQSESIVRKSGLRWTVFRPSVLVTPEGGAAGSHGARHFPRVVSSAMGALRRVGGLRGPVDDVRPMPLDVLARAFLAVLVRPRDGQVLVGRDIWALADDA